MMAADRPARAVPAALLAAAVIGLAGCGEDRPAITLQEHQITIENRTGDRWTDIEIWLNDHYRVTARELLPGGRLNVPLDTFVAGFGQRYDRRRQSPFGIEVTARTDRGKEIRIEWGKGRRR